MSVPRDAERMSGLRAGDEAAIRSLVSTYHAAMVRFARTMVSDAGAEEVVQEAWLKIIRALPGFEGRSSLRTWLFTIVRNEAVSRLRQDARQPQTESANALADRYEADGEWRTPPAAWSIDTPEGALASKDMREVMARTLADMPATQRAVVTLRDIEGLGFEEICNIFVISSSNARVLLHRGRQRLWQALERYQKG
ncbi:MAG: sigma-70 family RNA polymerase sigma factor [Alphaproteobacteria bacterium]|nr:sigma-70 family RNA polymerase sigma factor [Alphaproteobacteria bacterium]